MEVSVQVPVLTPVALADGHRGTGTGDGQQDPAAVLAAARTEAEQVVAAARAEAERVLAEAASQCEAIRAEALQKGWQEGYEAGFAAGRAEAQSLIREAQAVLDGAARARRDLIRTASPVLVRIAMAGVRRLLGRELATAPADVEQLIGDLLEHVVDQRRIEVRVHPADFLMATEAYPRWRASKFGEWEIVIVPDAALAPGGCEIRSESGRVDARMETKLQLLETALRAVMDRSVTDHVDGLAP